MSETFNLDRHQNVEHNIDPQGKKWNIYHIKGSALYEARPEPYRVDTEIPDEFKGRWTKPTLLDQQIKLYVNRAWDAVELAQKKAAANKRAAEQRQKTREENEKQAKKVSKKKAKKKTVKESIDELPDEIKEELGETIATKEDE